MLTVLTPFISQKPRPEAEAIDRDPGIIALLASMIGSARRDMASAAAGLRESDRQMNEAALFISASNAQAGHRRSH